MPGFMVAPSVPMCVSSGPTLPAAPARPWTVWQPPQPYLTKAARPAAVDGVAEERVDLPLRVQVRPGHLEVRPVQGRGDPLVRVARHHRARPVAVARVAERGEVGDAALDAVLLLPLAGRRLAGRL